MSGIHQVVPMLHVGDAVGRHTSAVRALLRQRGISSQIYVELEDPDTASETRPASCYPGEAEPGDLLVYQFATASDLAPWAVGRPEPLVVNYHNVTPPELFAPWDNWLARHQVRARGELALLATRAALGVAVSELNRADLVACGFAATTVVPPVVPPLLAAADPSGPADRSRSADGAGARWLAVGRLAPNKAVEDILIALLAYRMRHDPAAELTVVGKAAVPAYAEALRRFAAELGLAGAVHFCGQVADRTLADAYRHADALVVTSEHEGFCLPVVEAMALGVPVVAFRQGALPEVLGDAGVLLATKDPVVMADALHRVRVDGRWRRRLVTAGLSRVGALDVESAGARLVELLVIARNGDPWPQTVTVGHL